MPGKGNPQLQIRLPAKHWIWRIEDVFARNRKICEALELYRRFEILRSVYSSEDEIKEALFKIFKLYVNGGLALEALAAKGLSIKNASG